MHTRESSPTLGNRKLTAISRRSALKGVMLVGASAVGFLAGVVSDPFRSPRDARKADEESARNRHGVRAILERLPVGMIGSGGRGQQLLGVLMRSEKFRLRSFVDPNAAKREEFEMEYRTLERKQPSTVRPVQQPDHYRAILDDTNIEGVFIATPPHWHAKLIIEAIKAGKHVYCEKPLALTVEEALRVRQVMQGTDRVLQIGTQRRSSELVERAVHMIREGTIGDVRSALCYAPGHRGGMAGTPTDQGVAAPPTINWDLWLGPAPAVPYSEERRDEFRLFHDYSLGQISNWCSHLVSTAMQGMDLDRAQPISASIREADYPDGNPLGPYNPQAFDVSIHYAGDRRIDAISNETHREAGVVFRGDNDRTLTIGENYTKLILDGETVLQSTDPTAEHLRNWYQCIREGGTPHSDIDSQVHTTIASLLAAAAMRCGETVYWDARHNTIRGGRADATASVLRRPQRAGYELLAAA